MTPPHESHEPDHSMKLPPVRPVADLFAALELPVCSVLGPVRDYSQALMPAERAGLARAVAKRQREFATGRAFARTAMAALGLTAAAVPAASNRAPQWPPGMLGSISHSDELAWVVACRDDQSLVRGLGADLERLERLGSELHDKLFTSAERLQLQHLAEQGTLPWSEPAPTAPIGPEQCLQLWATLWFSAKEAVYKATAPIAGAYIGFQEVELVAVADGAQFTMRYLGEHAPSRIMELGQGYLTLQRQHALALFVIPE